MRKRIAAGLCILVILAGVFGFASAEKTYAEPAGETLIVRVQYAGEREEKIREKARFTKSELEAMGASAQRYTNVTRVGTIMAIVGRGPKMTTILERAGIDLNSIQYITFRTTDGTGEHQRYSRNFTVSQHLTASRYYYPNLQKNYKRVDDNSLIPLHGSLRKAQQVPSILALESASTKQPDKELELSEMTTEDAYRFCLGQGSLQEGVQTKASDATAVEAAKYIFGVDVTLAGSPVTGLKLNLDQKGLKVGSRKRISAVIQGDELFKDDWGFTEQDLIWKSSDPKIASVDSEGIITVKKEGTVTITATAPNGISASVTIDTAGDSDKKKAAATGAAGQKRDEQKKKSVDPKKISKSEKKKSKVKKKAGAQGIVVKEVKISGSLTEAAGVMDSRRGQMAEDAQALDKAEESNPKSVFLAAFTSALAFCFGGVLRLSRFLKEV